MENFTRELKSMNENPQLKTVPKKIPGPEIFIGEFFQQFKVQIMLILHKFFYRPAKEGTLPIPFAEPA